jgi:DNA repair exonuclease SbcCD ATPase subunit
MTDPQLEDRERESQLTAIRATLMRLQGEVAKYMEAVRELEQALARVQAERDALQKELRYGRVVPDSEQPWYKPPAPAKKQKAAPKKQPREKRQAATQRRVLKGALPKPGPKKPKRPR